MKRCEMYCDLCKKQMKYKELELQITDYDAECSVRYIKQRRDICKKCCKKLLRWVDHEIK